MARLARARRPARGRPLSRSARWLRPAVAVFLLAALAFTAYLLVDRWEELAGLRGQVRDFPWRLDARWLVAATALALAALFLTATAWVRLFRAFGERIALRHGLAAWFGSNLGRYIPGKVWQLSGLAVYLKGRGHPAAATLSSVVLTQVLTLLTGLAVGSLVGAGLLTRVAGSAVGLAVLVAFLAVLAHPAVIRKATAVAARWLGEEAIAHVRLPPGALLRTGAILLGVWVLYGLGFWCLLRGLVGVEAAPGPLTASGIFAASYVAGYIVLIAPGGLVVREGAMAAFLTAFAPQPAAVAAAVAVAARIWVTAAELLGTAASLLVARHRDTVGRGGALDTRRDEHEGEIREA